MGGRLVSSALAASFMALHRGEPLTSNERLVLLTMCANAKDTDNPPRYFGGRELLAELALGRRVPPPSDEKARRSLFETVRKAVQGLVRRGYITPMGGGYLGQTREYAITVDNLLSPADLDQQEIGS